jgi:hypothetical protein
MRGAPALVVALTALSLLSCAQAGEQVILTRFFAASRLRDLTAVRNVSTVVFEPASDGIVTSFDITDVTERAGVKEVSISAPVKLPDGQTVVKAFVVSIQGGMVTAFSERPAAVSIPPR